MSEAAIAALGVILSALISGGFGYLIKRSADRAAHSSSRSQIEAAAFERAEQIYVNALNLAKAENAEHLEDIQQLRTEVARLEAELEAERTERREAIRQAQAEITNVRLDLREKEAMIAQLKRIISRQEQGRLPASIDLDDPGPPG